MSLDAARLAAVISPLRRVLLGAAREQEALPDLPDAQIEIMRLLPRGTVISPGEIATRLGRNPSTISNLLAAMERGGLVARRTRDDDRRHVEVMASATALDWFARYDRAAEAILDRATAGLDADQLDALRAALPVLEHVRDALLAERAAGTVENAS